MEKRQHEGDVVRSAAAMPYPGFPLIGALVMFGVLAGCATAPGQSTTDSGKTRVEATNNGFYNGKPELLFATEFPIASAEEAIVRGDVAMTQDNPDLALFLYVSAYEMDSQSIEALMRIGHLHQQRGNSELAGRAFSRALDIDPEHTRALQAYGLTLLTEKRYEEAEPLLWRAVAADANLWRSHNALGVMADLRGDHYMAVNSFNAALESRPGDPSILNNRGYSLYLVGDYGRAAQDFRAAGEAGMDRAWLNLGLVQARQKAYFKAVKTMSRVVEPAVAYNDVGYVAMRQDNLDVAQHYFEEAIRLSPRHFPKAKENLAELSKRIIADEPFQDPIADTEILEGRPSYQ